MSVRVESLVVGGEAAPWQRLGFVVVEGRIPLHGAGVRIDGDRPGLREWELSGLSRPAGDRFDIDGVPTVAVDVPDPVLVEHRNGVYEVDHVVITTDDLMRTSAALESATGAPCRRVREAGPMRQAFHRLAGVVVELVEHGDVDTVSFFGVAFNCGDLAAAVVLLGPAAISEPKDAVQPGRRIATVREVARLGLPVAIMSVS